MVDKRGELGRDELATAVGARRWGPGRFSEALQEASQDGRVRRVGRGGYGPAEPARG